MNNEFCQTSNVYRTCSMSNRCCNLGCMNTYQQNNCCPTPRPQPPCCPTTITVGTTTTGAPGTQASVTNSGTATNAILNFVIPEGDPGAATINVGTTTTLPAGSQAFVTNSGTSENVILNFGIPRGETGPQGPIGPTGATGPQGPAGVDGTAATITIGTTTTGLPGTNASVTNIGTPTDAILNFVIPAGAPGATGATGPQGPVGATGATGATGPQGPAGIDGTAATVTVGTTTTGEPGTAASVTNVGTENAAILNFVIPAGEPGTITPGVAVTPLAATATLDDVITTVNALITSLTNAGFLA